MRILDLGTGSGYLSFPIAKNNPGCEVIGLDIVNAALETNRTRADSEGIKNLSFISYDGIDFPFEEKSFDLVVTRYALHHFPDIEHMQSPFGVWEVLVKDSRHFLRKRNSGESVFFSS